MSKKEIRISNVVRTYITEFFLNKPSYIRLGYIALNDQILPEIVSLCNDGGCELSILGIAIECKLVLWLAIGNFVNLNPRKRFNYSKI